MQTTKMVVTKTGSVANIYAQADIFSWKTNYGQFPNIPKLFLRSMVNISSATKNETNNAVSERLLRSDFSVLEADPQSPRSHSLFEGEATHEFMQHIRDLVSRGETRIVVWKSAANRATQLVPLFTPHEIVQVLFQFGLLRLRDARFIDVALHHLHTQIHVLHSRELAYCLSSLARLRFKSELFFKTATPQVAARASEMSRRDLGEIIYAYASFGFFDLPLHNVVRQVVVQNSLTFKATDIFLLLTAYKTLRLKDPPLLASLIAQANRCIADFTADQLAMILNVYEKFRISHPLCLQVVETELFKKRESLTPFGGAMVLYTAKQLMPFSSIAPHLLTYIADQVLTQCNCYQLNTIALAAQGLASLAPRLPTIRSRIEKLFLALGKRVGELSLQLTPNTVSALVDAFSKSQVYYDSLFLSVPVHVERFSADYSPTQLAQVLRGYSRMNIFNRVLLDVIVNELERFCLVAKDPKDTTERPNGNHSTAAIQQIQTPRVFVLVGVLESFAQWEFCVPQAIKRLRDELNHRAHELSPKECVRASKALAHLTLLDRETLVHLSQQLAAGWKSYRGSDQQHKASLPNHSPLSPCSAPCSTSTVIETQNIKTVRGLAPLKTQDIQLFWDIMKEYKLEHLLPKELKVMLRYRKNSGIIETEEPKSRPSEFDALQNSERYHARTPNQNAVNISGMDSVIAMLEEDSQMLGSDTPDRTAKNKLIGAGHVLKKALMEVHKHVTSNATTKSYTDSGHIGLKRKRTSLVPESVEIKQRDNWNFLRFEKKAYTAI